MKEKITVSQCMIVKNEEKNIRKALEWGQGIVMEQIVVDTGSTDNTVKIADEMGAKVFHFQWIDDFSAAKNFAIEKAHGTWIVFLDADQYFLREDAVNILPMLQRLESEGASVRPNLIACRTLHLNDSGVPFMENAEDRLFRNLPSIRYEHAIHECLVMSGQPGLIRFVAGRELTVFHTGYSESSYKDTGKLERNIRLLKVRIQDNPEDYEALSYLGDGLMGKGELEAASKMYNQIIDRADSSQVSEYCLNNALMKIMQMCVSGGIEELGQNKMEKLYSLAAGLDENYPDPDYYMGIWYFQHQKQSESRKFLEAAMKKLEIYEGTWPVVLAGKLAHAYQMLTEISFGEGDGAGAVKYAIFALRLNRYLDMELSILLRLFVSDCNTDAGVAQVMGLLRKIFDYDSIKDKLFLLKCAKQAGNRSIAQAIELLITEEEKI